MLFYIHKVMLFVQVFNKTRLNKVIVSLKDNQVFRITRRDLSKNSG